MADPTFRQKWEWARAHQTPAFDAPALVVDNVRGVGEPMPPDWTQDALRSVPRPLPAIRSPADGRYVEPQVRPAPPPVFQGPIRRDRGLSRRERECVAGIQRRCYYNSSQPSQRHPQSLSRRRGIHDTEIDEILDDGRKRKQRRPGRVRAGFISGEQSGRSYGKKRREVADRGLAQGPGHDAGNQRRCRAKVAGI